MQTLTTDDLNDAEIERMAQILALRRAVKGFADQREMYVRNHEKRLANLALEEADVKKKLSEMLNGGK